MAALRPGPGVAGSVTVAEPQYLPASIEARAPDLMTREREPLSRRDVACACLQERRDRRGRPLP
jgi:hypothetical protein